MGLVPPDLLRVDCVSVDRMSRAMLEIALRPRRDEAEGQANVFHLVHPRPIPFPPLTDAIQAASGPTSQQLGFK